mmetsp:Transcript_51321/g.116943  ORF Transcript_51321/g.116943 Transcript_51321/m.116943 type:complete len:218 (-) Transcript_51321:429-1082(-)
MAPLDQAWTYAEWSAVYNATGLDGPVAGWGGAGGLPIPLHDPGEGGGLGVCRDTYPTRTNPRIARLRLFWEFFAMSPPDHFLTYAEWSDMLDERVQEAIETEKQDYEAFQAFASANGIVLGEHWQQKKHDIEATVREDWDKLVYEALSDIISVKSSECASGVGDSVSDVHNSPGCQEATWKVPDVPNIFDDHQTLGRRRDTTPMLTMATTTFSALLF